MRRKSMTRVQVRSPFLLLLLISLSLLLPWVVEGQGAASSFRLAQSQDCGSLDEIEEDVRTKVPWTAAIFYRNKDGSFKFLENGVVLGPTTVMSVSGGAFGKVPRGLKGKYKVPNPERIRIGAGMTSSNMAEQDSAAQYSDVSYVLPYNGHEEDNVHFHFMLYHLRTPLVLSGPQVRAICLPFVLRGRKATPSQFEFLQGGFTIPPKPDGTMTLQLFKIVGAVEKECEQGFAENYNSNSTKHIYCGRILPASNPDNKCLVHGSTPAFKLANRWFLAGITSLIPAIKNKACDPNGLYIHARTLPHLDWIFNSFKCSPNKFACEDDGSCIPLSSVCNAVPNCKDGSDESAVLCAAESRCSGNIFTHGCGLNGKCISKDQLCDRQRDCPDGSDEDGAFCSSRGDA